MTKLEKRRLYTLIFTLFLVFISFFSALLACKRFIYFDNLVFNQKTTHQLVTMRNISFFLFIAFNMVGTILSLILVKYRGHIYDRLFRMFKVVGVINRYSSENDFVDVVLKNRGKYYFPVTNEKGFLVKVAPLTDDDIRDITKIKKCNLSNDYLQSITFGENCYFAFQTEKNKIIIEELKIFKQILAEFKTNNLFTQKRIKIFLESKSE